MTLEPFGRSLHRVLGVGAVDGDRDLLAKLFQLVDRSRALQVGGHEARLLSLPAEVERELCRRRRLARPLKARHQDHGGRTPEDELRVTGPHQLGQAVVNELDDLLSRIQAF